MTSNMGSQLIQAAFENVTEENKEEVVENTKAAGDGSFDGKQYGRNF